MSAGGAIRLDRLLANLGYGSRRDVLALVRAGRVRLDGAVATAADGKLVAGEALRARLTVDGEPLDPLQGLVVAMNKPAGHTCSRDEAGPLVYDLLPSRWQRRHPPLSTIGRLDKETTGLLLFTDDGALLHRLISPKSDAPKLYRATLARPLGEDAAATFASGTLTLSGDDKPLRPAELTFASPLEACVTVTEGRYHQVRRMFAACGGHVVALHRERVGGLTLPDALAPGQCRALAPEEAATLRVHQGFPPG